MSTIYKICPRALWQEAEKTGRFAGATIDLSDGFIHFSTAGQVKETAAKHFAGQDDLLLVAVDGKRLGTDLKYETSRGGALFPHVYGPIRASAVRGLRHVRRNEEGDWLLPADLERD